MVQYTKPTHLFFLEQIIVVVDDSSGWCPSVSHIDTFGTPKRFLVATSQPVDLFFQTKHIDTCGRPELHGTCPLNSSGLADLPSWCCQTVRNATLWLRTVASNFEAIWSSSIEHMVRTFGDTSLTNSQGVWCFFKFRCLSHLVPTTLDRPAAAAGFHLSQKRDWKTAPKLEPQKRTLTWQLGMWSTSFAWTMTRTFVRRDWYTWRAIKGLEQATTFTATRTLYRTGWSLGEKSSYL